MIKSFLKRDGLVILLFFLLTVIITYPLIWHLSNWTQEGADSYFITWNLAWDVHMFQKNPLAIFNANIFYPHANTLAYSENLIGTALLAWPLIAATNNAMLANNILIFLFFIAGGYFMYRLGLYLTKNTAVSVLLGIMFGFNPYKIIHFSQMHLQIIFFFPLVLLILHNLVKKQKNRHFVGFTLVYILLGYMSAHYFFMTLIVTAIFLITYFAVVRRAWPGKKFLIELAISVIAIIVAILPVFYPYLQISNEVGYARSYGMVNYFSPTLVDYFAFSPLLRDWIGYPQTIEKIMYFGFTFVFLSIFSVIFMFRKFRHDSNKINWVFVYLMIGLVCFLLSFGVLIRLAEGDKGIVGPFLILYKLIPGFDSLRALGRFSIVMVFSSCLIIGLALNEWFKKIKSKKTVWGIAILIGTLIFAEYLWIPPFQPVYYEEVKVAATVPEVYRWLADQSERVIIEFPLDAGIERTAEYLYFSTFHWNKLVNGYSGFFPQDYLKLEDDLLKDFPSSNTVKELKGMGVNYVIIHQGIDSAFTRRITPESLSSYQEMPLVQRFDDDYVYELI